MIASSTSVTRDRRFNPTRAATMVSLRPRASWVSLRRAEPVSRRAAALAAPGSSTLRAPWPRPSATTLPLRALMRST